MITNYENEPIHIENVCFVTRGEYSCLPFLHEPFSVHEVMMKLCLRVEKRL